MKEGSNVLLKMNAMANSYKDDDYVNSVNSVFGHCDSAFLKLRYGEV
jgi:hypothetical protein